MTSIFGTFRIFVASGQGKRAESIDAIRFFMGYQENAKYPPDKNCLSHSSHEIVGKLAYLCVKIISLKQKQKIVMKVANIRVSKLRISLKDIKSPGKLPISVSENSASLK